MQNFNMNYGLHDTLITAVKTKANELILSFGEGVYCLDENGRETHLTPMCQLVIKFMNNSMDQHIIIERRYKKKINEISIPEFFKLMENDRFDIDIDYYSPFAKSIMLLGYIGKYQINLILSEISEFRVLILE